MEHGTCTCERTLIVDFELGAHSGGRVSSLCLADGMQGEEIQAHDNNVGPRNEHEVLLAGKLAHFQESKFVTL